MGKFLMSNEQENSSLRKQKNTQNIDEKSKILKLAFANHNRHISLGLIKETINSKPDAKFFETFKSLNIVKELGDTIENWNYEKLNETDKISGYIKDKLKNYDFS